MKTQYEAALERIEALLPTGYAELPKPAWCWCGVVRRPSLRVGIISLWLVCLCCMGLGLYVLSAGGWRRFLRDFSLRLPITLVKEQVVVREVYHTNEVTPKPDNDLYIRNPTTKNWINFGTIWTNNNVYLTNFFTTNILINSITNRW